MRVTNNFKAINSNSGDNREQNNHNCRNVNSSCATTTITKHTTALPINSKKQIQKAAKNQNTKTITLILWRLTTYIYTHIYIHIYVCVCVCVCVCVYIYIYMSYRTANLQTLHFKYLLNKYTY